jgi:septum site-determining protein MinD
MGISIGVISIKGGVGKTTVAASLAADLANHHKKKVLLVDGNYSAPNLGLHMDVVEPLKTIHDVLAGKARPLSAIHTRYGVDVIPGSYFYDKGVAYLKLKDRLESIKNSYDFVVIDSSPTLDEETLSTMLASDRLFVITTPDYPTLSCSLRAASLAKKRGKPVSGIIVNKIRDPLYELSIHEVEDALGIPVVAQLPDEKDHVRALFTRIPMPVYNRKSPFSREINRLSAALVGEEEQIPFFNRLLGIPIKKAAVNRQLLKQSFYKSVF